MAKCKDCLHYEPCSAFSKIINAAVDVEKGCEHFKDRTKYEDVVRCQQCKHYGSISGVCYVDRKLGQTIPPVRVKHSGFCSYGERRTDD